MKQDITQEKWMTSLKSTGINTSYYSWEGKNFMVNGERDNTRIEQFEIILPNEFFKNKHVIDIGCNIGRYSHYAIRSGASSVFGYDVDPNTLIAARKIQSLEQIPSKQMLFLNVDFTQFKEHMNILLESDIAFCLSVLWHINPRKELLSGLNNSIKQYIIIEAGLKESPFNSFVKSVEDLWDFDDFDQMLAYLLRHLNKFKLSDFTVAVTERNRFLFVLERKM